MTQIKEAGFSCHCSFDSKRTNVLRHCGTTPHPQKATILGYLASGKCIAHVMGPARDVLDPKRPMFAAPDILTDGEWVWSTELNYYFDKYNYAIAAEFVAHMETNQWKVPDAIDIHDVAEGYRALIASRKSSKS